MSTFSIAGIQLELKHTNNKELVLSKISNTLKRYPWVNMVVLSELAVGGSSRSEEFSFDNNIEYFKELAAKNDIWLIPGTFYQQSENKIMNVAPVISNKGEVIELCSKIYPFLPYENGITGGKDTCVFEIENVGTFGIQICYDLWFPETSRSLAMKGAQIIIHPSLTDTCDRNEERIMARATAIQQQCFYFDINAAGEQGCGQSIVIGPEGQVMTELGSSEEVCLIEIDLEEVNRVRRRGIKGLGQPIKSFRDNPFVNDDWNKNYLDTLGKLELPKKLNQEEG